MVYKPHYYFGKNSVHIFRHFKRIFDQTLGYVLLIIITLEFQENKRLPTDTREGQRLYGKVEFQIRCEGSRGFSLMKSRDLSLMKFFM